MKIFKKLFVCFAIVFAFGAFILTQKAEATGCSHCHHSQTVCDSSVNYETVKDLFYGNPHYMAIYQMIEDYFSKEIPFNQEVADEKIRLMSEQFGVCKGFIYRRLQQRVIPNTRDSYKSLQSLFLRY